MGPPELSFTAKLFEAWVQPLAAESRSQRLRQHDAAGRIDRDPVSMKRHLLGPVCAEARIRLPGHVGEEARSETEPLHLRRILENGGDPRVEQVTVLAEAIFSGPRMARFFDQRILRATSGLRLE